MNLKFEWWPSLNRGFSWEQRLFAGKIEVARISHKIGAKSEPQKAQASVNLPGLNRSVASEVFEITETSLSEQKERVESLVMTWFNHLTEGAK